MPGRPARARRERSPRRGGRVAFHRGIRRGRGARHTDQAVRPAIIHGGKTLSLRASQSYCRDLTRREARNFYWGFVALPRPKRMAIYALYGFARQVDDEVDLFQAASPAERLAASEQIIERLEHHRARLERCYAGDVDDPIMHVLANIIPRYQMPKEELAAIVKGVEMDLTTTRYETWEEFRHYCHHVASSVGRLCVRVFGFSNPVALDYAVDLGVAMQLSNALRDIREDYELGRIYLPQEDLRRFGVGEETFATGQPGPGWEPLMRLEIERAQQLFTSGLCVTNYIPRRAGVCVLTMAGIYRGILSQLARDPEIPLRRRASLGGKAKLAVMLKSWVQAM